MNDVSSSAATAATPRVSDGVGNGNRSFGHFATKYAMFGVLVALIVVATILYPGFLNPANIGNILAQNAAVGLIAIGMTFVIISGGFDLSVGATYALGATLFAGLTLQTGSVVVAGIGALAAGLIAGLVNGLIISRLSVNPFVATLGTSSVISGIAYIYSNSSPFIVNSVPAFQDLALTRIAGVVLPIWILIIAFVLAAVLLAKTTYGRNVYAVGGNYEAAWLTGLRVKGLNSSVYVFTGALAALAGMMDSSRLGVGQADVGGAMALDAIAIVVVGGTSLLGGEGAIWRSAVGLLILATLTNVFYSLNVSQHWQLIAKGIIVVAAVAVDAVIRAKKRG
ncbi:ABC transporter permease [Leucobacter ruminantium]|uniref:Autoinducer 2 import system permease protein LsrD n=1 Tax=Leucobacter ruminantium TaxID=1289170 RepID=A0A939LX22_9MICO|nr:ABC transporter permease [Leucobacter ruminantium]MBO1803972.1 ABC transporter permease [Leucobacter ruminantium]